MAMPVIADSGGEDFYVLDNSDRGYLRALIDRERMRQERGEETDKEETYIAAHEVLIVKLPEDGIPARESGVPGKAECEVFWIKPSDELDPHNTDSTLTAIENPDGTAVKEWVYNIYPIAWVNPSSSDYYITATRDRFGRWICEPRFLQGYAAVANANIPAGDVGSVHVADLDKDVDVTNISSIQWDSTKNGWIYETGSGEDFVGTPTECSES